MQNAARTAYAARPFGSLNGTYINSERVNGERELKHGDDIALGGTRARYDDGSGRPLPPPPAYGVPPQAPPPSGWQPAPPPSQMGPPPSTIGAPQYAQPPLAAHGAQPAAPFPGAQPGFQAAPGFTATPGFAPTPGFSAAPLTPMGTVADAADAGHARRRQRQRPGENRTQIAAVGKGFMLPTTSSRVTPIISRKTTSGSTRLPAARAVTRDRARA